MEESTRKFKVVDHSAEIREIMSSVYSCRSDLTNKKRHGPFRGRAAFLVFRRRAGWSGASFACISL